MLVLSRKSQQDFMVGDNVRITVLQIKGNTVRLGISAPRDVPVRRGELTPQPGDTDGEVTFSLIEDLDDSALPTGEVIPFEGVHGDASVNRKIPDGGDRLFRIREMLARIRSGESLNG